MENRFIIDSSNYIDTKLYGYMITDDGKIIENYNGKNTRNGCFCLIINKNNNIDIYQDYIGCFGIYLYEKENYFALSNNLLYLINYLHGKLTLNEDYYRKLINAREVAFPQEQTLCNEIKRINGSYIIHIINGKINLEKIKEQQYSINITSKEYLNILDKWYTKWLNIYNNIYKEDVLQDLSGGIDTRILLSMALNSDTAKSILFRTKNCYVGEEGEEDYIISNKLINYFYLNKYERIKIFKNINNLENNFIFGNSNFSASIREKPVKKLYRICGNGGLLYHKPNTFKNLLNKRFYKVDNWLIEDFNKYLNNIEYPDYLDKELYNLYAYKKLIVDLRDGIKSADYYNNGTILLCPMMDKDLNSLNINKNGKSILPFIILQRYYSKLLNFPFEGLNDKLLSFDEKIKPLTFNCHHDFFYKNPKIYFYNLPKKEYENKFKIFTQNTETHSTGSEIGQTYYTMEKI